MNRVLNFAVVAMSAVIMTSSRVDAAVVNITQGSMSGYTMTDGNTYVIQNSVSFSNSTAGGSGMTVEDGATVVIFVPSNVTLTAMGANGSGQTGGGAGILVPETSTLIITGEGTVNASGGNAGDGGNGGDGLVGSLATKYNGQYKQGTGKGSSGIGGSGGDGGGGAGAGIGGTGGYGGSGGNGGVAKVISSYVTYQNFPGDGNAGTKGTSGEPGRAMGYCYVIGSTVVIASNGNSGVAGRAGSIADGVHEANGYYEADFASCGGGGAGGGGAGSAPSCSMGGGGASGGGGGGGGSGALTAGFCLSSSQVNVLTNAYGGGGCGGGSLVQEGISGTAKGSTISGLGSGAYTPDLIRCYGGDGGAGGTAGAEGGAGTLYVSPTATVDVEREKLSATTHPAVQYTITFDATDGQFSSSVESLTATLGCELPDCIPTPTKRGYLFYGWRTVAGEEYYDDSGAKSISCYPATSNVVLYAQWHLDVDRAVLPDSAFWLRDNAETGWFVDSGVGGDVILRSGQISNSTNSWMEATIEGPASFSFDWKVSCNTRGHYLAWFIDGVEQARIRGEVDWATVAASIPEGEHVVRFDYVKGSTSATGEDKGQVRNFSINPVRIETDSMQVLLDWTTNYLVSVSTTGFGTTDFESGWIADGSNVVVAIAPSIHSYSIVLSGDTEGAVLDGTNLTFQVCGAARSITISIDEVKPHLVVVSAQGTPTPAVGDNLFSSDAEVTASVEAPNPAGGVRAVCTGWTGTGSVPASGEGDSVTFVITEDSSITWNWSTGYWVEFSVVGKGTTSYVAQWVAEGTNLEIPFSVNTPFYSLSLSGDADGAVLGDGSITVPITGPRSIVLTVTENTYKAALDDGRLTWMSGGAANWIPQVEVSHDGQDAVRSGEVTGDDVSTLTTVVAGSGTLSWWWKLDMTDCAGVDVFVDNVFVTSLDSGSDWMASSVNIVGDGDHVVRFEFWNAGTAAAMSDCVYLDQISWTGGLVDHTITTPAPVPYSYFDMNYPTLLAEHDGDYEEAAQATAMNGHKVWECYVVGLDPQGEEAFRITTFQMNADGTPDLNSIAFAPAQEQWNVPGATPVVKGAATLDGEWQTVTEENKAGFRFFKVVVEVP